jgi:U3 small nucleolar RNA-associated protein 22
VVTTQAPVSAFKLSQLRPQKNNVRPSRWLDMIKSSTQRESEWDLSTLSPTPHYNMAILEDLTLTHQHTIVSKVMDICPCARDATVIAKVWLTQRGYRFGLDSLDGHTVTLLIAYLFQQRTINAQMSSFTVFQCLLKFLSESDFSKDQLSFVESSASCDSNGNGDLEVFSAVLHFPIEDGKKTHFYNLFWRLSASFVDEIHEAARISLAALTESSHSNSFNQVFMSSPSFFKQYDLLFHVPIINKTAFSTSFEATKSTNSDAFLINLGEETQDRLHDMSAWQECSRGVRELIVKALGDRALKVRTLCTPLSTHLNSSR